jgi:hypothetical protein
MATPFVMSCLKEEKFKKEIEFKIVSRILALDGDKLNEPLFLNGLKCSI